MNVQAPCGRVCARVLEAQAGSGDVHHGLFESPGDSLQAAQQRALDRLWQVLPPPCRLLAVGARLGSMLARLRDAGYSATGIAPDAVQVQLVRERHGQAIDIEHARPQHFVRGAGQWQALVFHDSSSELSPVALFDAADRLLNDGPSTLVVMDEFAIERREDAHQGLNGLAAFCALAVRRGWKLVERVDLSAQARPMFDHLLDGLQATAERPGGAADQQATLRGSLERSRALYEQGVYGYALLRFERDATPEDRFVEVTAANAPAMRTLFAEVFRQEMSPEHWHWKYGDGHGRGIALMRGDHMVAHYGGMTRPVLMRGKPVLASQICDVMVDRRSQAGLARQGPLAQVAATFLESQLGWGQPHLLGFGFPNDRHFGAARRLRLYTSVDTVVRLAWPPAACGGGVVAEPLRPVDVGPQGRRRGVVDRLWGQMAASLPEAILGVRDAAWLAHRYFARPGIEYELFYLRRPWTRRPVGVVALRRQERHLEVLDLVGPTDAFPALIAQARQRAAELGLDRVECWVTSSHARLLSTIDPAACSTAPMGIVVPANVHTPAPVDELKDRWFLLAGDADFT